MKYLDPSEYTLLDHPVKQETGIFFVGYRNKIPRIKNPAKWHLSRSHKQPNRIHSVDGVHPTLSSSEARYFIHDGYGVRRLTGRECLRLMGFTDDFKIVVSESTVYKQAGNSIVVDVLMNLFSRIDWETVLEN